MSDSTLDLGLEALLADEPEPARRRAAAGPTQPRYLAGFVHRTQWRWLDTPLTFVSWWDARQHLDDARRHMDEDCRAVTVEHTDTAACHVQLYELNDTGWLLQSVTTRADLPRWPRERNTED